LLIPEKLYGREREVDTLLVAFDHVVAGARPELVLVSGYSGVGKSAVVHEIHKSWFRPVAYLYPASSISTSATSLTPLWRRLSRALPARS
jgi:Cdc6-like AAA superfamily ATPase